MGGGGQHDPAFEDVLIETQAGDYGGHRKAGCGGGAYCPLDTVDRWQMAVFLAKALIMVLLMMWVRWTLPRLRVDQLMRMAWKYLIPLTFFNLLGVSLWLLLFNGKGIPQMIAAMIVEYLMLVNADPSYDRDEELLERIGWFVG